MTFKRELERQNLIILSAIEKSKHEKFYTEISSIISVRTIEEMQQIEHNLQNKGLERLS